MQIRAVFFAALLVGCASGTSDDGAAAIVVVQSFLLAGRQAQTAFVSEVTAGDTTVSSIAAAQVDLWLVSDTGDSARFVPAGPVGAYGVSAVVAPDHLYHLRGAVGGRLIDDSTIVPAALTITHATTVDTAIVPVSQPYAFVTLHWQELSTAGALVSTVVNGQNFSSLLDRNDSAAIAVFYQDPALPPQLIRVTGVDERTFARLLSSPPAVPAHGVIVVFGSGVADSIALVTVR